MEDFIYELDGKEIVVKAEHKENFESLFPKAVLKQQAENFQPGVPNVDASETPVKRRIQQSGQSSGFASGTTSSESQEDKYSFEKPFQGTFFGDVVLDYFGDIGRAFESGAAAGMSVDEAFDIYRKGASISDEDLDFFIEADKRIQAKGTSDEMLEYQNIYKEEGGGILGFLIANAKTRGQVLPQIIASSVATMATSLESGEVRGAALTGAGTGALIGSSATPIGTVTGAVGGGVAGLVGAMETSLTLSELLKEEIGSDTLTKENIRAVLEDSEKMKSIKNKSLGRGIAIGAVEGITLGLSRGLATSLSKGGMKASGVTARVAGLEAVGGSTGEIAGRIAADQEMDTSDILFEGVAELKGVVNVTDIINKSQYKLNGEIRKKKDIQEFISTATPEQIAGANIDIKNDNNFKAVIDEKQKDVYLQSTIPAEVTNPNDRFSLFKLEKERIKYKGNDTKTAQNMLSDINSEIKEITDKYRRRGRKSKEIAAQIIENEKIQKATQDRTVAGTIEFAQTQGEKIGLKTIVAEDNKSFEAELKKDGIKLSKEDKASIDRIGGYIQGNKIYINKDAAGKTGQINVGGHELLHGIIESANIKDMGALVNDFKKQLSQDQVSILEAQMVARGYGVDSKTYSKEYLTNFSDAIVDGTIKFNENLFTKIGEGIVNLLKIFGYENINFKNGKGVYNFMKEYSKNIKEGKLSESVIKQAGTSINVEGAMSVSPESAAKVNQIYKDNPPSIAAQKIVFDSEVNYRGMAEKYLNDFIANPNLSDEQKGIMQRNREDIAAMMLYDRIPSQRKGSKLRNVIGLVEGFEEVKNQYGKDGVAGYINKFFRRRGLEAINYYLKDSGLKNIETEEGTVRKDVAVKTASTQNIEVSEKQNKSFERKITLSKLAKDILSDPTETLTKVTNIITKELKLLARNRVINIEKIEKVIQKEIRKVVVDGIGKIKSEQIPGTAKRRAVIPTLYSTIIETKFNEIADAMSLIDIKKRYNKLFKVTDTGKREKTAEGNPIFTIAKPIKAEFIKYFTDTNIAMTTLVERQKMLGEIISKAITSKILKEYNSNDSLIELAQIANLNPAEGAKAVTELQLANEISDVAKQLDTYEGEKMLQDTRLFSIAPTAAEKVNITKAYAALQKAKGDITNDNYLKVIENLPVVVQEFVEDLYEKRGEIKGDRIGGPIYESILADLVKKESNIEVTAEGGFTSGPDLQLKVRGAIIPIEIKADPTADFGSISASYNTESGKFTFVKDKETIELKDLPDGEILKEVFRTTLPFLEKKIEIANKALGIEIKNFPEDFNKAMTDKFGSVSSKNTAAENKKVKDAKKAWVKKNWQFNDEKNNPLGLPGPKNQTNAAVIKFYNDKKVYYIQIGGKGLYRLGEDKYNLGASELKATFRYPVRLKPNGRMGFNWQVAPKIEAPAKVPNSDISLENTKDIKTIEQNINKNKGFLSRAARIDKTGETTLDKAFNDILEEKTGIASDKVYSKERARIAGKKNKKMSFYISPGAEDFTGLMYKLLSKGKLGDAQMAWIKKHILNPYSKAMDEISIERVALFEKFRALKKEISAVPKKIKKKLPGTDDTYETAVRVYMWDKQGMDIPGLTKKEIKELVSAVKKDKELKAFGDQLITIFPGGYPQAQNFWLSGNITTDFLNGLNTTRRAEILSKWQSNVDEIFSEKNLNKLESQFGENYKIALKNILGRMKTGSNRPITDNKALNDFYDWINGAVGVVMFLNMRSAILQTISMVNYINWNDNNILAAGKAFANQKQYWADFKTIWNSDFLKNRRGQLKLNVSESEIADMADKGGARGVVNYLLKIGYTPTRVADSFAIAAGGASMFRNRTKSYMKNGFSQEEAELQAFRDFQELTEEAQQSSRPDRISKQQASTTGRLFLAWANTPMQYGRLIKRSTQDLIAGRGDRNTNISKIVHYSFLQNIIFNFMQKGAFALAFAQEEDDEKRRNVYSGVGESMADSIVKGAGVQGTLLMAAKSLVKDIVKESKKSRPDYEGSLWKILEAFPPIDAKMDRAKDVVYAFQFEKEEMIEEGLAIGSPGLEAIASGISFASNVPVDRALRKIENIKAALDDRTDTWARIALLLGWGSWSLGLTEDETAIVKNSSRKIQKRKIQKRKIQKRN
jgi:hypothetical protein